MPSHSRAWSVARPSFRESGAAVADDVYPGTKHNGASVSSLYLLDKWQAKLIIPIYFGTKTFKFWIISFSSLESELSFDSKDSKINFDRARSPVRQLSVKSLHGALEAICNISSDDGEGLFAHELFIRNGKLATKWRSRKTKSRKEKSRTALDGKFDT